MAQILFSRRRGGYTLEAVAAWEALPEAERETWRDRAFQLTSEHARTEPPPTTPPDEPGPGMGMGRPVEEAEQGCALRIA